MTVTLGNLSLGLAMLVAALAVLVSMAAAKFGRPLLFSVARRLIAIFAILLTVAGAMLTLALYQSDFSLSYVARYTERALPLGYKLAAFWAGQEGSLLFWAWLIAIFSVLFCWIQRNQFEKENAISVAVLSVIGGFFVLLMLFGDANPFALNAVVPLDGRGLNPMLQDPGMIAHPPTLFAGYAGYAIPFAMMIGALIAGRKDNDWIAATRRWLVVSWIFLTVGIILGAQWAYVELGWGGYWAWDPVENASLLPWLTGTALLHSIMAQQHRGMLKAWNAVLIALSFILCIFGTYLTRSGVVGSVHSFGQSRVGNLFLGFLMASIAFTTVLLIVRHRLLKSENKLTNLLSKEGAFLITNVLLVVMTATVTIGTIYPLISTLVTGKSISVSGPFYNKVVVPMGVVLVGLMALGPLLSYGATIFGRRWVCPAIGALAGVGAMVWLGALNPWGVIVAAIVGFAAVNVVVDFAGTVIGRIRSGENPLAALLRTLDGNHRRWGGQIVHVGMLLVFAGIAGSSIYGVKQTVQMHPGQTKDIGGFRLTYNKLRDVRHSHYTAVTAFLDATAANGQSYLLTPQCRFYDKEEQKAAEEGQAARPNSEVAIRTTWRHDLYVALSGWEDGGNTVALSVLVNPLVIWFWIGGIVMTAGGVLAVLPRFLPRSAYGAASADDALPAVPVPPPLPSRRPAPHAAPGGQPAVARAEARR